MAEIREVYGKVIPKADPLLGGMSIDELHDRDGGLSNAQEANAAATHDDATVVEVEEIEAPRPNRVLPDDEMFDHMKGTAAEIVERLIQEIAAVYGVPKATARSAIMGAVMES